MSSTAWSIYRALLVMVDSLVMVNLALKASTADHSERERERERESQDQDECIYDQERSRALPRTNKCQDQREYNGKSRAHKI